MNQADRTNDFASVEQADAFASDLALAEGMRRAGVVGALRTESPVLAEV